MVRGRWAIAGVLALAMLAAACGSDDKDGDSGASQSGATGTQAAGTQAAATQQAQNIKRGGTLTVAMEVNPKDFDSMRACDLYSGNVSSAIIEGLVDYDKDVKPQPWLAEKMEISPDATVYTFPLKKGIMFHDGTEMDAEAVKFSMDRVRDEKNKQYCRYSDGGFVQSVDVVDKYTVKITLKEPNAAFPSRLTGGLGAIVSPTAVRTLGDDEFNKRPVGTGPFKFGEFKNDVSVRVTKNENYWRDGADGKKLPYLDAVEWRIITEPATRFTALQAGDIDLTSIRDQDAKLAKEDKNLTYAQQAGFNYGGFSLALDKPPFDNKALRQALQYAIDRDEIIKAVYEGNREFGNGPIALPLSWAIDRNYKPYTYDLAKAKAKLAEGGQPNGFEFSVWIDGSSSVGRQLYELMQQQVARAGIKMNVETGDFNGVVVPKWQKREGQAFGISWSTGIDPDQSMTNQFTPSASFNFFPYDNPKVSELITKARQTPSVEERGKLYKEAVPLIMEDAPYVFLVYGIDRHVGNKKVQGWTLGPALGTSYSQYWKE